jgi:hypothetical protein
MVPDEIDCPRDTVDTQNTTKTLKTTIAVPRPIFGHKDIGHPSTPDFFETPG